MSIFNIRRPSSRSRSRSCGGRRSSPSPVIVATCTCRPAPQSGGPMALYGHGSPGGDVDRGWLASSMVVGPSGPSILFIGFFDCHRLSIAATHVRLVRQYGQRVPSVPSAAAGPLRLGLGAPGHTSWTVPPRPQAQLDAWRQWAQRVGHLYSCTRGIFPRQAHHVRKLSPRPLSIAFQLRLLLFLRPFPLVGALFCTLSPPIMLAVLLSPYSLILVSSHSVSSSLLTPSSA